MYLYSQYFFEDEIFLQNLGDIFFLLVTETGEDEKFDNIYMKGIETEEQYISLFEDLSNHKSKAVSNKY